jgi:hypothetical protein
MTVLLLLVAWFVFSVPLAMLTGRFLRTASSHDRAFVRTAHAALTAEGLRHRLRAG